MWNDPEYYGVVFKKLKEQTHRYVVDPLAHKHLMAESLTQIPFSNPTRLISLLKILRKQLLMNFIVSNCIRQYGEEEDGKGGSVDFVRFQLSFRSIDTAECLFEHPSKPDTILTGKECHETADHFFGW